MNRVRLSDWNDADIENANEINKVANQIRNVSKRVHIERLSIEEPFDEEV